ncbi:hypothetical protein K435DRAFT_800107 [Dendrothele bispora CBS 962.96]|uniref:Uncharacterized protein n=1 Tax=Dendrothele bispora (strain CBS 962.96) TaxID=1314807 RepID=A0A4S8LTQ2_DENBC|nr:hypothetical protein K435DRAFT_800107 [Dendrothele bispora CBS 962.96]
MPKGILGRMGGLNGRWIDRGEFGGEKKNECANVEISDKIDVIGGSSVMTSLPSPPATLLSPTVLHVLRHYKAPPFTASDRALSAGEPTRMHLGRGRRFLDSGTWGLSLIHWRKKSWGPG